MVPPRQEAKADKPLFRRKPSGGTDSGITDEAARIPSVHAPGVRHAHRTEPRTTPSANIQADEKRPHAIRHGKTRPPRNPRIRTSKPTTNLSTRPNRRHLAARRLRSVRTDRPLARMFPKPLQTPRPSDLPPNRQRKRHDAMQNRHDQPKTARNDGERNRPQARAMNETSGHEAACHFEKWSIGESNP